jgi:hypothetical protein
MHPKKSFLATKDIKIQEFFWMKKKNVNHGLQRRRQKLDENRIKIGENFILHP